MTPAVREWVERAEAALRTAEEIRAPARTALGLQEGQRHEQAAAVARAYGSRWRIAEFGPPAVVEIPAGTTLRREIRWPPTVPDQLIVQVGYGYSEPDFKEWMGGSEWQWARVFEWQHVAVSAPFVVPTGK